MNCQEFHRTLGADPNADNTALAEHRASCAACRQYAIEMQQLNGLIKRALDVPVPERLPFKPRPAVSGRRWFAMAASMVLAIGIVVTVLTFTAPRASLAHDLIDHMAHEPQAMTVTDRRVSSQLLDGALRAKGLHLRTPLTDVSYLQSCFFRGHFVPHLVVQTKQGPVTVILMPDEKIDATKRFHEKQYSGILEPAGRGGMAVIATDAALADRVAAKIQATVAWN